MGGDIVAWMLITRWELISSYVSQRPEKCCRLLLRSSRERGLLENVYASWLALAQAFLWCAIIAIPLGLLMASFHWYDLITLSPRPCAPYRLPLSFLRSSGCLALAKP
jgi:ABC-type nitrate/sulfonate/bicarbonate transport system permease component